MSELDSPKTGTTDESKDSSNVINDVTASAPAAAVVSASVGDRGDLAKDVTGAVSNTNERSSSLERKVAIERNFKNLPKIADIVGGIDQLDLAKLDVSVLIKLEDEYPGILLYAFTDVIGTSTVIDFANWDSYKKPVAGQKLLVNFRGNEAANMKIGVADFMPPAVRCVTIESEGVARTSKRRIGLKGRNMDGNGFYDEAGYMPVFSGDTIIVGGVVDAEKNIDLNYEKPFLTKKADGSEVLDEESYAKYAATLNQENGEAKKDKEFIDQAIKINPNLARRKGLTEEEFNAIESRNTSSGLSANIVKFAIAVARDPYGLGLRDASCCWDWVNKIYKMAGVAGGKYLTKEAFPRYTTKYPGKDCKAGGGPGESYATEAQYDMISPGDWIFYNNRNKADAHGNHSVLFIEWIDKDKKLARVASGSAGIPWHVHKRPVDFNDMPMTYLGKPYASVAVLPTVEDAIAGFYGSRGGQPDSAIA